MTLHKFITFNSPGTSLNGKRMRPIARFGLTSAFRSAAFAIGSVASAAVTFAPSRVPLGAAVGRGPGVAVSTTTRDGRRSPADLES